MEALELYVAVILGVIFYATFQWNETSKSRDFSWMKNIVIPSWLSILTGCVLVWCRADLIMIYPITKLSSFMLGVSGQAMFRKFAAIFDPKINTVIGA